MTKGFGSDNHAGVHPAILRAVEEANLGHAIAYGDDPWTAKAEKRFKEIFGAESETLFVFNGTGANVLSLKTAASSFNSIICCDTAHINVDECGAPELFTGCKLLDIPGEEGKLTVENVKNVLHGFGFEHHSQPGVISITQCTEMGTVYSVEEIKALANLAHDQSMFLHMDGARIANAAIALSSDFREFTADAGVDVLSFGGTKNGMMYGEAVVFFNPELIKNARYFRKQATQLNSKMRFVSAQFLAYLSNDLWRKNAAHANNMAQLLRDKAGAIPGVGISQPVQANGVFAYLPKDKIEVLQKEVFFYTWDENTGEVRWMCSYDTTEQDIEVFVERLKFHLD